MSVMVNGVNAQGTSTDVMIIKHRWKGVIHATHNNSLGAGISVITGHLPNQTVTAYTEYTGTRWGCRSLQHAIPIHGRQSGELGLWVCCLDVQEWYHLDT